MALIQRNKDSNMDLFLKCFNVKLHMNTLYFGQTLEGTEQSENDRLKSSS